MTALKCRSEYTKFLDMQVEVGESELKQQRMAKRSACCNSSQRGLLILRLV